MPKWAGPGEPGWGDHFGETVEPSQPNALSPSGGPLSESGWGAHLGGNASRPDSLLKGPGGTEMKLTAVKHKCGQSSGPAGFSASKVEGKMEIPEGPRA